MLDQEVIIGIGVQVSEVDAEPSLPIFLSKQHFICKADGALYLLYTAGFNRLIKFILNFADKSGYMLFGVCFTRHLSYSTARRCNAIAVFKAWHSDMFMRIHRSTVLRIPNIDRSIPSLLSSG